MFDKEIVEFHAHGAIVTFVGFGFDFEGENHPLYAGGFHFGMALHFLGKSQMLGVNAGDIVLHFGRFQQTDGGQSSGTTRWIGGKSMAVKQGFVDIAVVKTIEDLLGKSGDGHRNRSAG